MRKTNLIKKIRTVQLADDPSFSLQVRGDFSEDGQDIYFRHPITGDWEQSVNQCFEGWSEQDSESNEQWQKLRQAIQKEDADIFATKLWEKEEGEVIEY